MANGRLCYCVTIKRPAGALAGAAGVSLSVSIVTARAQRKDSEVTEAAVINTRIEWGRAGKTSRICHKESLPFSVLSLSLGGETGGDALAR